MAQASAERHKMPRLLEKIAAVFDGWRDRWEARPKRRWQWWRSEPTQWHWHDPRRPAYAENGKPLTGGQVQRRWNGDQWEYRVATSQRSPKPAANDNWTLFAKTGIHRTGKKRRRSAGETDRNATKSGVCNPAFGSRSRLPVHPWSASKSGCRVRSTQLNRQ